MAARRCMLLAFAKQRNAIRALVKAGADINLLDKDRYDGVTIASVADDEETLRVLLVRVPNFLPAATAIPR